MAVPERHAGFRIIELLVLIRHGTYPSIRSIADRFGCSVRTAERYIEKIRDLIACDLTYDRKRGGYYFQHGGPDLPALRLSEGEAVAVFLAAKLLDQCRGTPYEGAVRRALSKLAYVFPKTVTLDSLMQPAGWVTFRMEPLRGEERQVMEAFLVLEAAREKQRAVRMRYFTASRAEWNEREIDPYHLHLHEGAWYVFAFCHLRGEVKIFALDRMSELRMTESPFDVPTDFSPEIFMADSFRIERGHPVDVAVRFSPEKALYVRGKRWHHSQAVEELPGGGLVLRMRVGGLGEIKRWVLAFGGGVEALEPEELRRDIKREAEAILGLISGDGGGE